jgi:hypothetical protein
MMEEIHQVMTWLVTVTGHGDALPPLTQQRLMTTTTTMMRQPCCSAVVS